MSSADHVDDTGVLRTKLADVVRQFEERVTASARALAYDFKTRREVLYEEAKEAELREARILNIKPRSVWSELRLRVRIRPGSLGIIWEGAKGRGPGRKPKPVYIATMNGGPHYDPADLFDRAQPHERTLVVETERRAVRLRRQWGRVVASRNTTRELIAEFELEETFHDQPEPGSIAVAAFHATGLTVD